jgi:hypothetical protein
VCTTPVPDNPDISDKLHKEHIRSAARYRLNLTKALIEQLEGASDIDQFLELYDAVIDELYRVRDSVNHRNPDYRAPLPINATKKD